MILAVASKLPGDNLERAEYQKGLDLLWGTCDAILHSLQTEGAFRFRERESILEPPKSLHISKAVPIEGLFTLRKIAEFLFKIFQFKWFCLFFIYRTSYSVCYPLTFRLTSVFLSLGWNPFTRPSLAIYRSTVHRRKATGLTLYLRLRKSSRC